MFESSFRSENILEIFSLRTVSKTDGYQQVNVQGGGQNGNSAPPPENLEYFSIGELYDDNFFTNQNFKSKHIFRILG